MTRQNVTRQNVTRQNETRQIVTRQNVAEPLNLLNLTLQMSLNFLKSLLTFASVIIHPGTEFNELELPTASSNFNHRFKFFLNL